MKIKYTIEGLYKEDKPNEFRDHISLKKDPPELLVFNEDGEYVIFELNKEQTSDLLNKLEMVNRAHYGLSPKKTDPIKSPKDLSERFMKTFNENPFKGIVVGATVLMLLYTILVNIL